MSLDIFCMKRHLDWLRQQGEFVGVPEVRTPWKAERQKWLYQFLRPNIRLREILPQELVIEYDGYEGQTRAEACDLIRMTAQRLIADGIQFIIFDHGGKSPHIHLLVDGLEQLPYKERCQYKAAFIKKHAAEPGKVDMSLCGEHLIAAEYAPHWKYGTIKSEVLSMMGLTKLNEPMQTWCGRCQHKVPCDYVDVRGFFYCEICADAAKQGELVLMGSTAGGMG